jgi:potassium-transporting ATPase KdpC subunit
MTGNTWKLIWKYLGPCLGVFVLFALLTGLAYPLLITGISQAAFKSKADGSLVQLNGTTVGSSLIGQEFDGQQYFHGRPSAGDYDAMASGASNLGPTNDLLTEAIQEKANQIREENGLDPGAILPADLVTASASGLDPDISPESALLQVERVAAARSLSENVILELVKDHIAKRQLGLLGQPRVNVLELNLALDRISG